MAHVNSCLKYFICGVAVTLSIACGGGGDQNPVAPKAITPQSIVLSIRSGSGGSTQQLSPNGILQLSAVVYGTDGKVMQGETVTYRSSNPTAAAVDGNGQVTAGTAGGTTNITAGIDTITSNTIAVVVPNLNGIPRTITKIRSLPGTMVVDQIDTVTLQVTDYFNAPVAGATIGASIDPACSVTAPATTDSAGMMTLIVSAGHAVGGCQLGVVVANVAHSVSFTSVVGGQPVAIHFVSGALIGTAGTTSGVAAQALDKYGNIASNGAVTFTTRNSSIATISAGSTVNLVAAGQTVVRATVGNVVDSMAVIVVPAGQSYVTTTPSMSPLDTGALVNASVQIYSPSPIGSATLTITWDPAVLTYVPGQASYSGQTVLNESAASTGTLKIAFATSSPATFAPYPTWLASLSFRVSSTAGRNGTITTTPNDITDGSFTNILSTTQAISIPVHTR